MKVLTLDTKLKKKKKEIERWMKFKRIPEVKKFPKIRKGNDTQIDANLVKRIDTFSKIRKRR